MRIILAILLLSACAKVEQAEQTSEVMGAPLAGSAYCAQNPTSVKCPNPYGGSHE